MGEDEIGGIPGVGGVLGAFLSLFGGSSRSDTSPQRRAAAAETGLAMARHRGCRPTPEEEDLVRAAALDGGGTAEFEARLSTLSVGALVARIENLKAKGGRALGGVALVENELSRRGVDLSNPCPQTFTPPQVTVEVHAPTREELAAILGIVREGIIDDIEPLLNKVSASITQQAAGLGLVASQLGSLGAQVSGVGDIIGVIAKVLKDVLGDLAPSTSAIAAILQALLFWLTREFGADFKRLTDLRIPQIAKVIEVLAGHTGAGAGGIAAKLAEASVVQSDAAIAGSAMQVQALKDMFLSFEEWLEEVKAGTFGSPHGGEAIKRFFEGYPGADVPEPDIFKKAPQIFENLFGPKKHLVVGVDWLTPFVSWLVTRGIDLAIPIVQRMAEVVQRLSEVLDPVMSQIFDNMIRQFKAFIGSVGNVAPDAGFNVAGEFVTKAGQLGTQAHLTALAFEFIPYLKHFGINQTVAFMADAAAFAPIAAQTWGQAIGQGVGRPAGYQINAVMRSRIPEERDLFELLIKRIITEDDFRSFMAFHGYLDKYTDALVRSAFRGPRLTEIIRLSDDNTVDRAQIAHWIQKGGYTDENVEKLTPIVEQLGMRSERARLLGEVTLGYKEGLVDDFQAESYFDTLRLPPQAKSLLFQSMRLAFRREMIEEHLRGLTASYDSGLSSAFELLGGIQAIGVNREKALAIVATHSTRRTGRAFQKADARIEQQLRQVQTNTIQGLKEQFEFGRISDQRFLLSLLVAGVEPQLAASIVALEQIKLKTRAGERSRVAVERLAAKIRQNRQDGFIQLFRKDLVEEWQLRLFLRELGLDNELIDSIVQEESILKLKAPSLGVPTPPTTLH